MTIKQILVKNRLATLSFLCMAVTFLAHIFIVNRTMNPSSSPIVSHSQLDRYAQHAACPEASHGHQVTARRSHRRQKTNSRPGKRYEEHPAEGGHIRPELHSERQPRHNVPGSAPHRQQRCVRPPDDAALNGG
jgi:hypothetical protein